MTSEEFRDRFLENLNNILRDTVEYTTHEGWVRMSEIIHLFNISMQKEIFIENNRMI